MDSLGLSEQIRRIATARHIVSAAGAGLAAMIFAPPGAKIVALADQVTVRSVTDRRFDSLATACEHEFSWLECAPSGRSAMALPFEATITVDLLQLNSTLRRQHIGA
jgi:capsular polysaccharide biosynthesis protein